MCAFLNGWTAPAPALIGEAARRLGVQYPVIETLPGGALSGSAEPSRFSDRAFDKRYPRAVAERAKSRGATLRERGSAHTARASGSAGLSLKRCGYSTYVSGNGMGSARVSRQGEVVVAASSVVRPVHV